MTLVDTHCHLDGEQFDSDREKVIERARAAGLKYLLAIGTGDGPPDLEAAVRLAAQHDFIYATVGVHPNDAPKCADHTFDRIAALLQHPKVKALGEIGLDYHWDVPRDVQSPVFRRQLALAAEAWLPIVIHTRDAWADTLAVLRSEWAPTGLPCIMHCFTGGEVEAAECLELGFYLSFGGVTTFPKSETVRRAVRMVPADKLLLETDCPYLAPVPHRGQRNEPAYVVHTARVIAAERAESVDDLAAYTTANFERVMKLSRYTEGFTAGE